MSGLVRLCRVSDGTCSVMSDLCLDMFVEVGFVSGSVRRGRLNVGNCSASSV